MTVNDSTRGEGPAERRRSHSATATCACRGEWWSTRTNRRDVTSRLLLVVSTFLPSPACLVYSRACDCRQPLFCALPFRYDVKVPSVGASVISARLYVRDDWRLFIVRVSMRDRQCTLYTPHATVSCALPFRCVYQLFFIIFSKPIHILSNADVGRTNMVVSHDDSCRCANVYNSWCTVYNNPSKKKTHFAPNLQQRHHDVSNKVNAYTFLFR